MQVLSKADFTIIGVENQNRVYADLDIGIVKIIWQGVVDLKAAQGIMNICTELISEGLCSKIIVDRHALLLFKEEALAWMQESLSSKVVLLKEKVEKIATVNGSDSNPGSISMIDNLLAGLKPEVNIYSFQSSEEADNWIMNVA